VVHAKPRRGVPPQFFIDEDWGDLRNDCGHNLRGTVYVEAGFAYRCEGGPRLASVGEVEYANGVGALFASGHYGGVRACAGIVGRADLHAGDLRLATHGGPRAPDRFRGIRHMVGSDPNTGVRQLMRPPQPDLLPDRRFREGFAALAPLGLSFDAYCYHPQLAFVRRGGRCLLRKRRRGCRCRATAGGSDCVALPVQRATWPGLGQLLIP